MKCPRCGSENTSHNGTTGQEIGAPEHHYGCRECWNTWMDADDYIRQGGWCMIDDGNVAQMVTRPIFGRK